MTWGRHWEVLHTSQVGWVVSRPSTLLRVPRSSSESPASQDSLHRGRPGQLPQPQQTLSGQFAVSLPKSRLKLMVNFTAGGLGEPGRARSPLGEPRVCQSSRDSAVNHVQSVIPSSLQSPEHGRGGVSGSLWTCVGCGRCLEKGCSSDGTVGPRPGQANLSLLCGLRWGFLAFGETWPLAAGAECEEGPGSGNTEVKGPPRGHLGVRLWEGILSQPLALVDPQEPSALG